MLSRAASSYFSSPVDHGQAVADVAEGPRPQRQGDDGRVRAVAEEFLGSCRSAAEIGSIGVVPRDGVRMGRERSASAALNAGSWACRSGWCRAAWCRRPPSRGRPSPWPGGWRGRIRSWRSSPASPFLHGPAARPGGPGVVAGVARRAEGFAGSGRGRTGEVRADGGLLARVVGGGPLVKPAVRACRPLLAAGQDRHGGHQGYGGRVFASDHGEAPRGGQRPEGGPRGRRRVSRDRPRTPCRSSRRHGTPDAAVPAGSIST